MSGDVRTEMIDTLTLNERQREAVLSNAKYLRIIAGAGSGKTRVLTTRIAHLIEDEDIFPNRILAITFTNKAANEMKERVSNMLADNTNSPFISTVHSMCVRILREDIGVTGWPRNFTVADSDDQKSILKQAYKKFNMDAQTLSYGAMLNYISANKTEEISPSEAKAMAGQWEADNKKADIYAFYENRLNELFALDFDDLILKTVQMFDKYEEVLAKWQRRFHYILVDEFQDIDRVQYKLIKQLTGLDNSLLVVGDPDQTIYTWRGADVNIIMSFEKDYPNAETIILNQNYRSVEAILNGANSVIKNNRQRVDKELFTENQSDEKIVHYAADNDEYQAVWIAAKIAQLVRQGEKYNEIAVLYRSNYLSRTIEKGLLDERIPYIIYGGIRFYERQEIKDALCYLRMAAGADDLAFERVINRPKRGIGNKTLETISQKAASEHITMYEAVKNNPDLCRGKTGITLQTFVKNVENWKAFAAKEDCSIVDLFTKIMDESGYRHSLEEAKETERLENLKELTDDIKQFTKNYPESTLDEYLQLVSLYGNRDETETQQCVQLMTVHAAKGLEFDNVFVSDMNEGIFPNERALSESSRGIEEERRLAYVAFTRARKRLFLSEAGGFSFILQRMRTTSRFINEIDPAYIKHLNVEEKKKSFVSASFDDAPKPAVKSKTKYKLKDHVIHAKFGEGVVVGVDKAIVTIAFPYPYGVKKLAADFAGLKKKG